MAERSILEKAAQLATVVSLVGIVVAFIQLKAADKEFETLFKHQLDKEHSDSIAAARKYTADALRNRAEIDRINKQFYLTNQSQLLPDLEISYTYPSVILASSTIATLSFTLHLINMGNMAARYKVLKFDIISDGRPVQYLQPDVLSIGVLYPKQPLIFHLSPVTKGLPNAHRLNEKKIFCAYTVAYTDEGYTQRKLISRRYKIEYVGQGWNSVLTELHDTAAETPDRDKK
jgi:hypothetical protein